METGLEEIPGHFTEEINKAKKRAQEIQLVKPQPGIIDIISITNDLKRILDCMVPIFNAEIAVLEQFNHQALAWQDQNISLNTITDKINNVLDTFRELFSSEGQGFFAQIRIVNESLTNLLRNHESDTRDLTKIVGSVQQGLETVEQHLDTLQTSMKRKLSSLEQKIQVQLQEHNENIHQYIEEQINEIGSGIQKILSRFHSAGDLDTGIIDGIDVPALQAELEIPITYRTMDYEIETEAYEKAKIYKKRILGVIDWLIYCFEKAVSKEEILLVAEIENSYVEKQVTTKMPALQMDQAMINDEGLSEIAIKGKSIKKSLDIARQIIYDTTEGLNPSFRKYMGALKKGLINNNGYLISVLSSSLVQNLKDIRNIYENARNAHEKD